MIVPSIGPIDLIDLLHTNIADCTDAIIRHFITFNEAPIVGFLRFPGLT